MVYLLFPGHGALTLLKPSTSGFYPLTGVTPPAAAQFISSKDMWSMTFEKGQNCQVVHNCIYTVFMINILQKSLPPFPDTRRYL